MSDGARRELALVLEPLREFAERNRLRAVIRMEFTDKATGMDRESFVMYAPEQDDSGWSDLEDPDGQPVDIGESHLMVRRIGEG